MSKTQNSFPSARAMLDLRISREDALAEGLPFQNHCWKDEWRELWDSLNAKRGYGWDENPWVWRIEFKIIRPGTHVTITRKL